MGSPYARVVSAVFSYHFKMVFYNPETFVLGQFLIVARETHIVARRQKKRAVAKFEIIRILFGNPDKIFVGSEQSTARRKRQQNGEYEFHKEKYYAVSLNWQAN